jgi:hypothetical protein
MFALCFCLFALILHFLKDHTHEKSWHALGLNYTDCQGHTVLIARKKSVMGKPFLVPQIKGTVSRDFRPSDFFFIKQ